MCYTPWPQTVLTFSFSLTSVTAAVSGEKNYIYIIRPTCVTRERTGWKIVRMLRRQTTGAVVQQLPPEVCCRRCARYFTKTKHFIFFILDAQMASRSHRTFLRCSAVSPLSLGQRPSRTNNTWSALFDNYFAVKTSKIDIRICCRNRDENS